MFEEYDLKILSNESIGKIYDGQNNRLKSFVAAYFPKEILEAAGWNEETKLVVRVEKGAMVIAENETGEELLFTNELRYEIDQE